MTEPTRVSRLDLLKQMELLLPQLRDTCDLVVRRIQELRAMDGNTAAAPSRSGAPYERVPISPAVMDKTAAEVLLNPPTMPDLRIPDSRSEFRATPASALEPLTGVVDLGGDAVEDGEAIYEDDVGPSPEQQAAWRQWEARGPQGPIEDDSAPVALLLRLRACFAAVAGPMYSGPREAVRGYAECCEALGDIGSAIEAYEALLDRAREDDKPPSWVMDLRAKIVALRGTS